MRINIQEERIIELFIAAFTIFALIMMFAGCESSGDADPEPAGFENTYRIAAIMPPMTYEDPEGTTLAVLTSGGERFAITERTDIVYQNPDTSCSIHGGDNSNIIVGHSAEIKGWTVTVAPGRSSIEASYINVIDPTCEHEETYQYTVTVYGTATPEAP